MIHGPVSERRPSHPTTSILKTRKLTTISTIHEFKDGLSHDNPQVGRKRGIRREKVGMAEEWIEVKGARTHNLRNIDVSLPRGKFVVISGVSGSGKSSLAFDTLYAEGQRRYVESLSSYARQFLGQMKKPDCDSIEGLSLSLIHISEPTRRS